MASFTSSKISNNISVSIFEKALRRDYIEQVTTNTSEILSTLTIQVERVSRAIANAASISASLLISSAIASFI